jgi:hypothetical protein
VKKVLGLILTLLLILGLFLALRLTKQRQEIRKSATSAGLIKFSLQLTDASGQTVFEALPEAVLHAQIILDNPQGLPLKVAGAEISFDPNILSVGSLKCDPLLPEKLPLSQITPGLIKLTCYQKASSSPPVLGSFALTVKKDAQGLTSLAFARTRAPQAGTQIDLADAGTPFTLAVIPLPTATSSPTPSPVSQPTPTASCQPDGAACKNILSCCSRRCFENVCQPCLPAEDFCTAAYECCSGQCRNGQCSY